MNIINIILLGFGIYSIVIGLWLSTSNFRSALIFKIIPFFMGLSLIIIAGLQEGWILQIN